MQGVRGEVTWQAILYTLGMYEAERAGHDDGVRRYTTRLNNTSMQMHRSRTPQGIFSLSLVFVFLSPPSKGERAFPAEECVTGKL